MTCLVLFALARRNGGDVEGLVAAAICALYPLFVYFSGILMAEAMFIFLTALILYRAALWEREGTAGNAALLGGAIGLAALCKPVILAWLAMMLAVWWRNGKGSWRSRTFILLVAGAMILPWSIRNYALTGHVVPISSNVGMNLFIGHEPEATGSYRSGVDYFALAGALAPQAEDPVLFDRAITRQALSWMASDPGHTFILALRKFLIFWSPIPAEGSSLLTAVGLATTGPLMLLGIAGAWQLRHRPETWHVVTLAASLSVVHLVFFSHARFRLPVDAALIAPAAYYLSQLWRRWLIR